MIICFPHVGLQKNFDELHQAKFEEEAVAYSMCACIRSETDQVDYILCGSDPHTSSLIRFKSSSSPGENCH